MSEKKPAANTEKLIEQEKCFFFITHLGLEKLAFNEFQTKAQGFNFKLVEESLGGFEVQMRTSDLLGLIPYLKIPTRILMRLGTTPSLNLYQTKVRDLPTLFQKASKFPWELYLNGELPEIEVSAKNSRLFDSRKIEKAIHDGINRHYQMKPVKAIYLARKDSIPKSSLFVRIVDDLMTVSIDLCGERLDRRGEKLLSTEAPMRETIAYALLWKLKEYLDPSINYTLLDPFLGSGTILKEAYLFDQSMKKRLEEKAFSFFFFPALEKDLKITQIKIDKLPFRQFIGFDIDERAIRAASENAKAIGADFKISRKDFFSLSKVDLKEMGPIVVLTNPPYGERLEKDQINAEFMQKLIAQFENLGIPKVGIIMLEKHARTVKKNVLHRIKLQNGGLDVEFILLEIDF